MSSGVYGSALRYAMLVKFVTGKMEISCRPLVPHNYTQLLYAYASEYFLPRDAMLARYLLLSCFCLSVRPSVTIAGIRSKRLDESNWFSARRLLSTCPTLCYEEIRVSPRIRELASGTLSQTVDFRHFKSILSTKLDRRRSRLRITSIPVYVSWLVALSLLHVGRL